MTSPYGGAIASPVVTVYSQSLQNVAVRVDLEGQALFRRVKSGKNPGCPRFKGAGQYDSIAYTK